jgi:Helicase
MKYLVMDKILTKGTFVLSKMMMYSKILRLIPGDSIHYRRQFHVIGAFAMAISKSQGQSFNQLGVYLQSQVFTHGQLYVALSRGKYPDKIKIVVGSTVHDVHNAVYSEVITLE